MKTINTKHSWGGDWTDKKLNAFSKYVGAYLAIMSRNKYWQTIYFDGFAGSGSREAEEDTPNNTLYTDLFGDDESEKENMVYRGSGERVVTLNQKFDHYYFCDTNAAALKALETKLKSHTDGLKVYFRPDNANNQLCKLAEAMTNNPKNYAALVFLDPFAMEVSWDCIEKLRGTRTDLWILVPTGTIINRLLGRSGELLAPAKLTSFFGLTEDQIREVFYKKEIKTTLFGESEIVNKIPDPIEKIADLYTQRLQTIWKHTTEKPLPLYNSKNVPIFHLIFASNNANAVKIASQIIKSV